jgi:hypothetical protein
MQKGKRVMGGALEFQISYIYLTPLGLVWCSFIALESFSQALGLSRSGRERVKEK